MYYKVTHGSLVTFLPISNCKIVYSGTDCSILHYGDERYSLTSNKIEFVTIQEFMDFNNKAVSVIKEKQAKDAEFIRKCNEKS